MTNKQPHGLWPPISCQEATRLLSQSMDRKLTLREMILLKAHLFLCDLCQRFETHIRHLRKLLRAYTPIQEHTLPAQWKTELKEALKNR